MGGVIRKNPFSTKDKLNVESLMTFYNNQVIYIQPPSEEFGVSRNDKFSFSCFIFPTSNLSNIDRGILEVRDTLNNGYFFTG